MLCSQYVYIPSVIGVHFFLDHPVLTISKYKGDFTSWYLIPYILCIYFLNECIVYITSLLSVYHSYLACCRDLVLWTHLCGLGSGRDKPHRPTETHLPLSSEIERVAMVILSYATHFVCFLHQGGVYFVNSK